METTDGVPRRPLDALARSRNGDDPPNALVRRVFEAAPGLTFNDLEARTGVNHETVRRYLRTGVPSLKFVLAFCQAFDVSADWLMTGEGPMRLSRARGIVVVGPQASSGGSAAPGRVKAKPTGPPSVETRGAARRPATR